MRFAARFFLHFFVSLFLFLLIIPNVSNFAAAQTVTTQTTTKNPAVTLNTEADVPLNQHNYVQSMFLELLIALECQLTGIDLANPTKSCLGINLETGKLGYAPSTNVHANGLPQMGGVVGMLNNGIGALFTPSYGTKDYVQYLASNFGVEKTHAYTANAFQGFSPILNIWRVTRDIAYFLLTIAFIFIGLGVMLRIHIDPRTVMTVQNQIPRVIICIILITFSYAFAALLADTMWVMTYMGINKLTQSSNPGMLSVCNGQASMGLAEYATTQIIQTPFGFVDDIFTFVNVNCLVPYSGILQMSAVVAMNLSSISWDLFLSIIGIRTTDCTPGGALASFAAPLILLGGPVVALPIVGLDVLFNGGSIVRSAAACLIGVAFGNIIKFFAMIAWFLIVTIIVIVSLFRIYFELLKAYIMVLIYVIVAPLYFVINLLPKRPLGFEKWIRAYFANLAVFPATVFILILARIFYSEFSTNTGAVFVAPLVGNPSVGNFGAILEFGMLIMAPTLLSILRDKMGTPPLKQAAAITQAFGAGRQAVGGLSGKVWGGLNRRNPTTGSGEAALSQAKDSAIAKAKRIMFEPGKGIFNRGDGSNPLARMGQKSWERSEMLAKGHGRKTFDEVYGARSNPNNQQGVAQLDAAMATEPRARSVADESVISQFSHLMSSEQREKRAQEAMNIEITLKTPGGHESHASLRGNGQVASIFAAEQLDTSTPGGQQAAAEVDRQARTKEGGHWNKTLAELSPLEAKRVEKFLADNSQHLKPRPAPPSPAGGGTHS